MSRIAKDPVNIPSGVTASQNASILLLKGPKGEMSLNVNQNVSLEISEKSIQVLWVGDENKAIEVCKNIEIHGSKSMAIHLEASNLDSIKKMVSNVENEFSKIDILVNNAGINRQAKMDDVKEEDWDDIMAVNLKGPFFCSREVFPIMKKNGGGRIINIGSVSGLYGGPTTPHYAASKAGVIAMSKSLALEYGKKNISLNKDQWNKNAMEYKE